MKQNNLKAYAISFVSYLIRNLNEEINKINFIVLYGSVAKAEATNKSDVDIFIDTKYEKSNIKIYDILKEFYSSKEAIIFKSLGVSNEISVKIGELEKFIDLQQSIASTGIILYGKYRLNEPIGYNKHKIIFFWDKIGLNRGAFLNKLYGFKVKGKKYAGLLEKLNCKKTGKSSIIVPIENKNELINLFKKYRVNAKQTEVFVKD